MVQIPLHSQGTRVRIRRGDYPVDASLVGRQATVIHLHRNMPRRYAVQLDGESGLRSFDESELEAISTPVGLEEAGAHQGGGSSDSPS
jgi:hypothetical protein